MLILKERLVNLPIVSLQTGMRIAQTSSFIIDPRQLKVVAFYCSGPRLDVNPAVLTFGDIREFANMGLIVDSADVLVSPEDLVRMKEVIDMDFRLDRKPVVDTAGHKLGNVVEYTLDSSSFYIVKLHVRPTGWGSWGTTEFLVDRTQVVEVTDDHIVVRDTREKKEVAQKSASILENPFRRAPVESSTTDEK